MPGDRAVRASAADRAEPPCPICGRPADVVLRPFCSKRCADVDLHRWLSGGYSIPVDEDPEEPGDDEEPSPGSG